MKRKRHRWSRWRFRAGGLYEVCSECLMRRRWPWRRRGAAGGLSRLWEYLAADVRGWEKAQRTCGPCPGKGAA